MAEDNLGFTNEDAGFLSGIDKRMDEQRVSERSFWVTWAELTPESRMAVVDVARQFIEDGKTPTGNALNLEFYKRLVRQWDNGELEEK